LTWVGSQETVRENAAIRGRRERRIRFIRLSD
jgi:hypothetical protein